LIATAVVVVFHAPISTMLAPTDEVATNAPTGSVVEPAPVERVPPTYRMFTSPFGHDPAPRYSVWARAPVKEVNL
jgi:hypothetical protein